MPILTTDNRQMVRATIWKELSWSPSDEQRPIMMCNSRFIAVSGGEGSGKSEVTAMRAMEYLDISKLVWIVGQEYENARQEFQYLADWCIALGLVRDQDVSFPKEGQCAFVTITGCHVVTKSAKDIIKLGRESPDLILIVEAAQITWTAFLRLRGRIARNRGDMVLSGTLEGSLGWWPELLTKWKGPNSEGGISFELPTWSNTFKYPKGNFTIRLQDGTVVANVCEEIYNLVYNSNTPPDVVMERYAGKVVKPAGLIFPEFNNEIHVKEYCEFNPDLPVEIAVDPGYGMPGAHVVLAIQVVADQFWIVDEIYAQRLTTDEIIDKMQRDYPWGRAWVQGSIDIAAKQHAAMEAPIEVWKRKTGVKLSCKYVEVEGGIELLRGLLLPDPRTGVSKVIVGPKCRGIISEMGGGPSPVPLGGPWKRNLDTNKPEPRNDHACKSFLYWCVSRMGYTVTKRKSNYGKLLIPRGRNGALVERGKWESKQPQGVGVTNGR